MLRYISKLLVPSYLFKDKLTVEPAGKFLAISWILIILLLPFHGFLSVWLSSIFGSYLAWRSWKEALVILMLIAGTWWLARHDKALFAKLARRRVNQLIAAYVLLHLLLSAVSGINLEAILYAIVYNLRFLGIFLAAQILGHYYKRSTSSVRTLNKLVLIPAGIVISFALLQATVLPNDFLSHFGYGTETIEPYVTIDAKDEWVRAQSTLRGPNQLGQYLILPLILMSTLWLAKPAGKLAGGILAGGLAMAASYSRSAWLGLAAALGALLSADKSWRKWKRQIIAGLAVLAMIIAGLAASFAGSDSFKLIVFHDDQAVGDIADSNTIRVNATRRSLDAIAANPLGHGPGYAGPASFHNDLDTKINENYYLQIALEVGVAGLLVFLSLNWLVATSLWRQRQELWPRVLFASFIGLFLINFFLPAWANDEIGLMWWGLAGLFYRE
ncbi:MAG TPA: O-antigen ligase family protein [Candidatus Saccharimonadales bacterium]